MSPWWFLVSSAVFLIGVTKSGFGSGVGLMIIPMTVIGLGHIPERGSQAALGLMLPLLILGDFLAVYQYRKMFSVGLIKDLLPGTLVGLVIGAVLLAWAHSHQNVIEAFIRIEIGCESIFLVSLHWWKMRSGKKENLLGEPWRSHITGGFSGTSSTLTHAAGPIIAMYLLPLNLERQVFVGTSAIYFFMLNCAKLPAYYSSGMFARAELGFTVKFVPLVIAGALLGLWMNQKISDRVFTKVVYVVTFALGWYVLIQGVRQVV